MPRETVYNFAAGPSVMPESALLTAQRELLDYHGLGLSVMEMSHRSPAFQEIFDGAKDKLRAALGVPASHEILFLQGGATLQFAAIPMNLMAGGAADYAVTGHFSKRAAAEAEKYGSVRLAFDGSGTRFDRIPSPEELRPGADAAYFHYCANNTVYGTEWSYVPETAAPLVCDMSSNILSKPVDVSRFGLIYAGAQKNMAPAGLTVVILDRSLAGRALPYTPEVMRYDVLLEHDSMLNTPPCWCVWMLSLVLDRLAEQGGVEAMAALRRERAGLLYALLDESDFYTAHARPGSRSESNVTFRTPSPELDALFVKEAAARGLLNLKGHKAAGGLRASLYNAMPLEGAKALAAFMKDFEVKHRV